MNHLLKALYILFKAGVPALIHGPHGIGKSSIFYALWLRIAQEREEIDTSIKHISTITARHIFSKLEYRPDRFWIWTSSAANLSPEEPIGYGHVFSKVKEAEDLALRIVGQTTDTQDLAFFWKRFDDVRADIFKRRNLDPEAVDDWAIKYIRSHSFMPPENHTGGGILGIDELNLSLPAVERQLMTLVLEGYLLDYKLALGIYPISSQNPPTGDYHSRELNPPTMDRFCNLRARAPHNEVVELFSDLGFDYRLVEFLQNAGAEEHLNPHQKDFDFGLDNVEPTSRSWEYVNNILNVSTMEDLREVGITLFTGLLGDATGEAFHKKAMMHRELEIKPDEVFNNYGADQFVAGKVGERDTFLNEKDEEMCMDTWPNTKVRRRVLSASRGAESRLDIIRPIIDSALSKMKSISERVEEDQGSGVDRKKVKHTDEERITLLNIMAFICDVQADQGSLMLYERAHKMKIFTKTIAKYETVMIIRDINSHLRGKAEKAGISFKDGELDEHVGAAA